MYKVQSTYDVNVTLA